MSPWSPESVFSCLGGDLQSAEALPPASSETQKRHWWSTEFLKCFSRWHLFTMCTGQQSFYVKQKNTYWAAFSLCNLPGAPWETAPASSRPACGLWWPPNGHQAQLSHWGCHWWAGGSSGSEQLLYASLKNHHHSLDRRNTGYFTDHHENRGARLTVSIQTCFEHLFTRSTKP